ncbi:MAG: site-specific DNA-methyltransferase [Desulfamplus sp.]|nr:site-specific DNA-methyltransferase [Desulfamplus sp.]
MPTLTWTGKQKVINHHQVVPLRVLEHRYGFTAENGRQTPETRSGNMIIHGDNLEGLKALLPKYEGKIKCIYIDPPYNTGNEKWVYNDNVNDPKFKKWLGQVVGKESEDLNRHDKWLCMMYPRLKLLHKLLADDGAIFISIDDNEQASLKLICDEIFGAGNFITNVIWERAYAPINLKKHFSENHDYIIIFAKNKDISICNGLPRSENANNKYKNPDNDPRGLWRTDNLAVGPIVEQQVYEITTPSGRKVIPPNGYCWRLTKERFEEMVKDNRIWFGEDGNNVPAPKRFISEVKNSITPMTVWKYSEVGHSQDAMRKLRDIFEGIKVFDYPKSVDLIKRCFELYSEKNSIILDSFAGSGTTAHAVLNLNKQDGGNRKFILIEMEDYAENITAERVKRVINGYGTDKNFVDGLGGCFDYYELGKPLFVGENQEFLNEEVEISKIREYVFYSETKAAIAPEISSYNPSDENRYYLGQYNGTAYYFIYEKDQTTTLNYNILPIIKDKAERYVIYADNCLLSDDFMKQYNITFKKIPRDITRL